MPPECDSVWILACVGIFQRHPIQMFANGLLADAPGDGGRIKES
jgi:hypothetical protein